MARQRLTSRLAHQGYDPDLLAEIGHVAHLMGDPREAGRFWLMSAAEGPELDEAVRAYVATCGGLVQQVVARLPRAARLSTLDEYPETVRRRWERLAIGPYVCPPWASWGTVDCREPSSGGLGCVAVFLLVCALVLVCAVVGAVTIVGWLGSG